MGTVLGKANGNGGDAPLGPKLEELHGHCVTKRIEELEAIVASLRAALEQAEAELQRERSRTPEIGDFVRCPLTNFFGQVTKVTPRPYGRPWVEIVPYLTKDLPGRGHMDLYDSWELVDPPSNGDEPWPPPAAPARLPSISSFEWPGKPSLEKPSLELEPAQPPPDEIELLLKKLWAAPG